MSPQMVNHVDWDNMTYVGFFSNVHVNKRLNVCVCTWKSADDKEERCQFGVVDVHGSLMMMARVCVCNKATFARLLRAAIKTGASLFDYLETRNARQSEIESTNSRGHLQQVLEQVSRH